ncbi:MAG: RNB domain-containing ribonuclease [Solirubrobacteraceae bacterium]
MSQPSLGFAAVLERRGRFIVARELFARERGAGPARSQGQLTVDPARSRSREGDLVFVRIAAGRRGGRPEIERRIGRPDIARDVIEALMLERGLRRRFDPAVEREAREATGSAGERRDLRALPTFTIDPTGARDYDDAISAQRLANGHARIWVHIADVASFVAPRSLVDREAQRRATSVYVPGSVEPMLPPALSNEKCSLVPGEDRFAVTAELDFDGARVERAAFTRSLIRSDERLDYARVDRIFAGTEAALEPWREPLAIARETARALAAERAARGGLEITSAEPDFELDSSGHVRRVSLGEQTESHRLIEHLMIATNEQVAKLLDERSLPALYRVHEQPDPERVQRLIAQLASLSVPTPPLPERLAPSQAGELVGKISQAVDRYVRRSGRGRLAFGGLILRSLKQAYYSPRNLGHAGLRSPRYCHFTSPIRRYPDLVCHRSLLAAIGAGEALTDRQSLGQLGEWTSLRERDATDIERAADDVARCFALARESRERTWEGEVVGVIGAGAFVAFGEGYEGLLPVRRMRGDWWELNEQGTILEGTRSGKTLRLGDPVRVVVHSIDAPRGRVDLDLG